MRLKVDTNIIFIPLILILIWISASNSGKVIGKEKSLNNNITIVSGNSGGTYYYIAAGQAKILNNKLGLNVLTQASTGSPLENLSLVANDKMTLGIVTLDGYNYARTGKEDKGFKEKIDNIEVLQIGHIAYLYALVLEKSKIENFEQAIGLKIGVPPVGSSTYYMALAILEAYGCNEENTKIYSLSASEQADALKDGDIDIAFVAGGISQSTVMDLDFSTEINFLSIDEEVQKKLDKKYPYWYSSVIPAGTYKNQKKDISSLTVNTMLVCNSNLDDDLAYKITKTLNESVEELGKIHISGLEWNKETTIKFLGNKILNFNLGAQKYYNEILVSGE